MAYISYLRNTQRAAAAALCGNGLPLRPAAGLRGDVLRVLSLIDARRRRILPQVRRNPPSGVPGSRKARAAPAAGGSLIVVAAAYGPGGGEALGLQSEMPSAGEPCTGSPFGVTRLRLPG